MSYAPKVYIRNYGTPTERLLAFTGDFTIAGKAVSLKRNLKFVAEKPPSGLIRLLLAGDAQSGTDIFLLSDSYQFLLTDSHQYGTYFYDVGSYGNFLLKVSDIVSSSSAVRIGATTAITEAQDTLSSAAVIRISASCAMSDTSDTVSATAAVPSSSMTISVTNNAVSSSTTITCPSCSNGDVIVLCDRAENTMSVPSTAVPSGFTSIVNTTDSAYFRQIISYKIANGTEGGTSLTGMSGNDHTYKGIFVIHGTGAISSVSVNSAAGVATDGDPSAQTVTSGSGTAPLIVFGAATSYKDNTSTLSMSPSADETISPDSSWQFGYKIFNSSPVNVTVDMSDAGYENVLQSCYLQVQ